jgi:hypothetical protein
MKEYEIVFWDKFEEYLEFLNKCENKSYDNDTQLHNHHIIPKFICNTDDCLKRIIKLSVEDHAKAHYILANCFEENTKQRIMNLLSSQVLNKNSIKNKKELKKYYEHLKGDNNPSKRIEVRKKISENLKEFYKDNIHPKKGKIYEEIYGIEKAKIEKEKRKKKSRSDEEYRISAKKISEKLKNRIAHNAIKVHYNGIIYNSYTECVKILGISVTKLKNLLNKKTYEKNS